MFEKLKDLLINQPQASLLRGLILIFVWFIFISLILILTNNINIENISNISKMGSLGDAFNGLTTPIIAGLTALLTYSAFHIQYRANQNQELALEKQKEALDEQKNESKIIQFENKFFELLKIHRANVSEMVYKKSTGRNIFIILIKEFDLIYRDYIEPLNENLTPNAKVNLTYLILFYGEGEKSTTILKELLKNYNSTLIDKILENIHNVKNNDIEINKQLDKVKKTLKPIWVMGQQNRLSHYFRHLYQIINFIDVEINEIYKPKTKEEKLNVVELLKIKRKYTKILRCQLSNHEQILLFYNSLSVIGKAWKNEGLISKYELIKNIPKGFVKIIDPKSEYGDIVFEHEEL